MEFTSTVLFNEELSYYNVATHDGRTFKARLFSDNSSSTARPPKEIVLERNGDHWESTAEEEILHYLRFDIDQKIKEGAHLAP